MNWEDSERYISACIAAKKTLQFLPVPPKDLRRQQIYQLKVLHDLMECQDSVKISDIAHRIGTTLPSVTKSMNELEENGYVKKVENLQDKRITNIALTDKGQAIYDQLIYQFHVQNAEVLADIQEEELNTTIETIRKIYQKMDAFNRYKGDEQFV
ncbi:winged helix DNA-binding protein [Enterococcus cecorum]|nr:winged helix DNA-binding protein [Enterococcus cecorum]